MVADDFLESVTRCRCVSLCAEARFLVLLNRFSPKNIRYFAAPVRAAGVGVNLYTMVACGAFAVDDAKTCFFEHSFLG